MEIALVIPLVVAFLGAGFGAYFAFVKTRKERLWSDRYEALRSVVLGLEKIQTHFEVREMHERGVQVVTADEYARMETEWPTARHDLRANIATLRLLFKDKQIATLLELHRELNHAFLVMFGGIPDHLPDLFSDVAKNAERGIEEAIKVAQKWCL